MTVGLERRRLGLHSHPMPDDGNVHGEDTVEFLERVRRQTPGPMTIPWDRGDVHGRSKVVRA